MASPDSQTHNLLSNFLCYLTITVPEDILCSRPSVSLPAQQKYTDPISPLDGGRELNPEYIIVAFGGARINDAQSGLSHQPE